MTTIELFISDLVEFVSKFIRTILSAWLRPVAFLNNLATGVSEIYIAPEVFTILSLLLSITFFYHPHPEIEATFPAFVLTAESIAEKSFIDKALFTFPICMLIFIVIRVISGLLRLQDKYKKVFRAYFHYLFSASLMLYLIVSSPINYFYYQLQHFIAPHFGENTLLMLYCLAPVYSIVSAIYATDKAFGRSGNLSTKFLPAVFIASGAFMIFGFIVPHEMELIKSIQPDRRILLRDYYRLDNNFSMAVVKTGMDSFQVSLNMIASNFEENAVYFKSDEWYLYGPPGKFVKPIKLSISRQSDSSLLSLIPGESRFVHFTGSTSAVNVGMMDTTIVHSGFSISGTVFRSDSQSPANNFIRDVNLYIAR